MGIVADRVNRMAELLRQRKTLIPVSVSERLSRAEDCDGEGRCLLTTTETDPDWLLDYPERCTNWRPPMTNWRQLCEELIAADDRAPTPSDFMDTRGYGVIDKIRAALAQSKPGVMGELTDQELLRCAHIATPCYDLKSWERELQMMRAAIAADRARRPAPVAEGERRGTSYEDISRQLIKNLAAARDALEAWSEYLKEDGQPTAHGFCVKEYEIAREAHTRACDAMAALRRPAPAAEGEMAWLVDALRNEASAAEQGHLWMTPSELRRAADLLEQRQALVRERPPEAEGLNDKGECWEWDPTSDAWVLMKPIGWTSRPGPWLPVHALPLPSGEVSDG